MTATVPPPQQPVEEAALFNPAFLAVLLRSAADQHARRASGRPLPVVLSYLVAPLALHAPTREALPTSVTASMPAWVHQHPELVADLATRTRALRPLVADALALGLRYGALLSADGGIAAGRLRPRRAGMPRSEEVDRCIERAGFLGRWFADQLDWVTALAIWGLRV